MLNEPGMLASRQLLLVDRDAGLFFGVVGGR